LAKSTISETLPTVTLRDQSVPDTPLAERLPVAKPRAASKGRNLRAGLPFDRVALLLQGGGALGAYQAGVYQALAEAGLHPDWVVGISIGAINAAIIEYYLEDISVKGAWTGPAALDLHAHALAPVAELPVLEVLSGVHIIADLTLGLGKVVHDYLR
jgi:hypothetical protein